MCMEIRRGTGSHEATADFVEAGVRWTTPPTSRMMRYYHTPWKAAREDQLLLWLRSDRCLIEHLTLRRGETDDGVSGKQSSSDIYALIIECVYIII